MDQISNFQVLSERFSSLPLEAFYETIRSFVLGPQHFVHSVQSCSISSSSSAAFLEILHRPFGLLSFFREQRDVISIQRLLIPKFQVFLIVSRIAWRCSLIVNSRLHSCMRMSKKQYILMLEIELWLSHLTALFLLLISILLFVLFVSHFVLWVLNWSHKHDKLCFLLHHAVKK